MAFSNNPIKSAWAVVLTSTNKYVSGVLALKYTLDKFKSAFPLLILHTPIVSEEALDVLRDAGCLLREIEPVRPKGKVTYLYERFGDTWTKLVAWDQEDYERLVLLDADMLPLHNMDELMTMSLPDTRWVAASHACVCNPQKVKAYPVNWIPSNCAYTYCDSSTQDFSSCKSDYFNSGLVVLTPSKSLFQTMLRRLYQIQDLDTYVFPDQDFLNEIFLTRWTPISYTYNALKTLSVSHISMWDLSKVKNIHYILSKPWDVNMKNPSDEDEPYMTLYQLWWESYFGAMSRMTIRPPEFVLLC
ncbi:hypothetical protein DFQ28_002447 [Apophysomyces sp. BC1034]|nr:hypothetical protein DFQ30_004157 [Apophysomyces sp. BC1015]KAG0178583.1 hypothetical protein DFQ29_003266 [Apophysomyces sp. BC1021]KAG0190135.1 hypothetical protein DFQ28_002447 [Apophysomyces sp. BC1034]